MITSNVADISLDKPYDFIIAGGGTAGLALAARLSENPLITVAVLEAGDNTIGDPLTANPALYGQYVGNPKYDWAFTTTKQRYSNNSEVLWSRGKGLGGTSSTNFFMWSLPPSLDVDAFEQLGNYGWNWSEFYRYLRKIEKPHIKKNATLPYTNGYRRIIDGAIHTTFPPRVHPVDEILKTTFMNKGIKMLDDPYKGNVNGTWVASSTIDYETWTRSSAATAYLSPAQDRPNLIVLTQALVSQIIFADHCQDGDLVATGIEFLHRGNKYTIHAGKEVVLSAGTIKDPQILELSGIGRREVLSKIGVDVRLELPGVGENLQEHVVSSVTYELDGQNQTFDLLQNHDVTCESMKLDDGSQRPLRTRHNSYTYFTLADLGNYGATNLIATIEKEIKEYQDVPGIAPGLREQLDVQLRILHSHVSPDFEIAATRCDSQLSLLAFLVHPLSRGTIHSKSKDPQDIPEIDPRYFEKDSDLELLVQGLRYIRSVANTEPMKSALVGEDLHPGPKCTTDAELRDYIRNTIRTAGHGLGTCSMLPRDKQGVVNPELKVYGTKNVRVVDISIIPIQIAAHTQASAYVIGEKAADFIFAAYNY